MKLKWTEEKLNSLNEANKMRKIPRYFAMKELIQKMVEEVENDYEETLDKIYN
jgi:hypothetical protein